MARAEALVAGYDAPLNWRVLAAERLSGSVARRFLWHLFPPVATVRGLLPPGAGRRDLLAFYLARPARLLGRYHRALAGVLLRRPAAVDRLGTLRLRGEVERWMISEPG